MIFIFNLVTYFYVSFFFEVLDLTEEFFDEVGPALSKILQN